MLSKLFKRAGIAFVGGAAALVGTAQAAIDYTALTSAITAADVTVAVLAVAGIMAVIEGTTMGAKKAIRMLKG